MRSVRCPLGLAALVLALMGGAAMAEDAPVAEAALAHADALQLSRDQARQLAQLAEVRREADRRAEALLSARQSELLSQAAPPSVRATTAPAAKDAKLVEFETSEAIAERLIKWAQWFALAVGGPMAILATVLAVLGVRSYRDFRARLLKAGEAVEQRLAEAGQSIDARLSEAGKAADRRAAEAAGLEEKFTTLHERLSQLSALEQNVRAIADKVERIEQFVGFEKSKALTPKLQASLEASLSHYRAWLSGIGCRPGKPVTIFIDPKLKDNAYYDTSGKIVIAEVLAGDPDVVLREYTHHILQDARPKGELSPFTAIQSGLADYLPCSFNNSPLFAVASAPVFNQIYHQQLFPNGYLRNMVNQVRLDTPASAVSQQAIGEGWGGAFWELRELIGVNPTDSLVFEAWTTAKTIADSSPASLAFARGILALVTARHPKASQRAQAIFERRGLSVGAGKARVAQRRRAAS